MNDSNTSTPVLIEDENLSYAWGRALLHIINNPGKEVSPLIVSLTGFKNGLIQEDLNIKCRLNQCLTQKKEQTINTVANTIFPESLWKHSKYNRHELFKRYLKILPRIKSSIPSKNRRGIYFERLINFAPNSNSTYSNQLEFIISQYQKRSTVRRTMLQASIFDPTKDHLTTAQLGFPCLQHISFVPNNKKKILVMNAFYATQQIFNKAYGNYLGLCRLGNFMAHEMQLTFDRINCFIGVAKLDKIAKNDSDLKVLIDTITNHI